VSDNRTEAPTPRRLSEARDRGQVARSVELNTAAIMLIGVALLYGPGAAVVAGLAGTLRRTLTTLPRGEFSGADFLNLIALDALSLGGPMAIVILGLMATGILVTVMQIGWHWPEKRPFADLSRVNPLEGLKRILSLNGLFELLKALLKLVVIGGVAYLYLQEQREAVVLLSQADLRLALARLAELAYGLGMRVGGVYLVLAVADYAYQRWQWMKSLRMTKEEVREDMKSQEGDPVIRGRIKQQARRLARQRMMARVPRADVVITNPTHFAVALQYDRAEMGAPQVVAKGSALLALRIREIAQQHNVPIIENPPLARTLYRLVEVDQEVPPELYTAVAEVLAFVFRLKAQKRNGGAENSLSL
jgi:flagellar biosynthetic protein FlhB